MATRQTGKPFNAARLVNDESAVVVEAAWDGVADDGVALVFEVSMNTHSVDLGGYDLLKLTTLKTDDGHELAPAAWSGPMGGHHWSGTLTFPATAADGAPTISAATREVAVLLRDIDGVAERSFTWTR